MASRKNPHTRFERFLDWTGWPRREAAFRIDCDASYLSKIIAGERAPGRRVANAVERLSASWPDGPIRSTEWDAWEDRQKQSDTAA